MSTPPSSRSALRAAFDMSVGLEPNPNPKASQTAPASTAYRERANAQPGMSASASVQPAIASPEANALPETSGVSPIPADSTAQRPLSTPTGQASARPLQNANRPQFQDSSHLQQSHFRGPSQGPRYFQSAAASSQYLPLNGVASDQYSGYSLPQARPVGYLRGPSPQYVQHYPQQRPTLTVNPRGAGMGGCLPLHLIVTDY